MVVLLEFQAVAVITVGMSCIAVPEQGRRFFHLQGGV